MFYIVCSFKDLFVILLSFNKEYQQQANEQKTTNHIRVYKLTKNLLFLHSL